MEKSELQEQIRNLYDVGEWMMEVVGGDPDDMEEHIKHMIDQLGETIHYLKSIQEKM